MERITNWLIEWFLENGTVAEDTLRGNLDANYLGSGFIDSFTFISLIGDIEDEFEIEFDNDQFLDRNFATINGLAEIIDELVG